MNQENRRTRKLLSLLLDGALLFGALSLAYVIRFDLFTGHADHEPLRAYLPTACGVIPVMLLLYGLRGLYDRGRTRPYLKDLEGLLIVNLAGTLLLTGGFYLIRQVNTSRWLLVLFFLLGTIFVGGWRFGVHRRAQSRHRRGLDVRQVVLIGSGEAAELYVRALRGDQTLGYAILGCVTDETPPAGTVHLGRLADLEAVLEQTAPQEVVAALSIRETASVETVIDTCEKTGIKLSLIPFYAKHLPSQPQIDTVGGVPLMNLRRIPLDNVANAFCKRAVDVVGAAVLLVLFSPLMGIAALGTRLSSPGPVIFRQTRVGRNNRPFVMLKFRSMRVNLQGDTAWTTDEDPRKTPFGSFLRKFSIDELPQLVNVLRGEMSLVGPRPELPHFVEQFRESVPLYMVKHQVRPGITGWAQVNGFRGDTSIPDRIRHDIWYIENWSLLLDAKILLMTLTRGFVNPEKLVKTR